ncbi:tape measure protein [Novosphingobium sp.]|uniref:tape measure protein n=1 Tax=Novosphingobium sp. TaxID=1874826 RepID=UPI00262CEA6B|nr:tape measure protein [Novosphingobium sp.]
MSLKFSMMLQAIDRVTGPAKRIQNSMKGIGRQAKEMARDVGRVGREASQITRLDRASRALVGAIGAAGRAAKHFAGKAGLGSWGDAAELAGFGIGRLVKKVGGFALDAAKWAGAAGIGAVTFSLYDLFRTAGEFEAFQSQLNREFGSIAKGKAAMDWINKFAFDTPYELDQVTESFLRLRSYGIDAMDGSLRSAGDAASGMNTDLMSGVEALADAMTGEYERLKGFGITASQQGKKVRLSWNKDGKAMSMGVAKNALDMKKAITGIWDSKFGGAMVRQSTTFFGIISNLKGAWTNFLVMVAQAGVFDIVKGKLQQLLDWVSKLAADGTLQKWAKQISDWLEVAVQKADDFVNKTDWNYVLGQIEQIATAASLLADAVITIAQYSGKIGSVLNFGHQIDDWLWSFTKDKPANATSSAPAAPPRLNRPSPLHQGASGYSKKDFEAAPPVKVGGAVKVELVAPSGWSVRTREMKSDNPQVPVLLQYGRSMGGAK